MRVCNGDPDAAREADQGDSLERIRYSLSRNPKEELVRSSTLRPGLLVNLSTRVQGNVSYDKIDIEPDHKDEDGARRARWETERTIKEPEEHQAAIQVRSKARSLIVSVCSNTGFGLLCPLTEAGKLDAAIEEADKLINEFNRRARITQVKVFVLCGRVEPNDAAAVRAIKGEIESLVEQMESGVRNLDVGAIRDAANKAREMGTMLSPEASEPVKAAIKAARAAARQITKAGEEGGVVVDQAILTELAQARTRFLDLDDTAAGEEFVEPEAQGRAVEFEPEHDEGQDRESYSDTQDRESYTVPEPALPEPARQIEID